MGQKNPISESAIEFGYKVKHANSSTEKGNCNFGGSNLTSCREHSTFNFEGRIKNGGFMEGIGISWPLAIFAGIFVIILFFVVISRRYVKVGPNEVLIISGIKHTIRDEFGNKMTVGFRIVKGGGTFVVPVFERVDHLSLELFTLDVSTPEVYTKLGVPILVDGVAQIKVKGDDVSIRTAAEQFLSKGKPEIMNIALQTLEGHLRAILGSMTVEEVYSNRDAFAQRVQEVAASDLANMGLTIISFTIRDLRDKQGYLEALGKPQIAQVKKNAIIGEAEANRDATIRSAQANQEGQTAKFIADTKVAESSRDYQMNVAQYTASVNQKKAEADLAYDLQKFKTSQAVKAEEIAVLVVEKTKQIEVQEKEISRREKELNAVIQKPADAERYRIETLASAEKFRLLTEAGGEAEATKVTGFAQADANKARGLAEADIIKAQGDSTAQAMAKKAEAWKQYNEAAIAQMLIEKLPEIARAIAEPLTKTEKIVIINSGGDGAGASKITRDVTNIIAQLPPVIESLTGLKFEDILKRIPDIGQKKTGDNK